MSKAAISIDVKLPDWNFWLDLGWYEGQPVKLIGLTIWEPDHSFPGRLECLSIIDFQALRFCFAFGFARS